MNKLERYLDQVCRGIAGPRALRQHIRRELGEHLRDAAAEHEAAGMSADEALERALEDFGGPEQVRAELEATHGHRLMTVVIDKAMQWKEKTMKKKWIWSTWAHAMVLVVIALEVAFVYGCVIFIVPKMLEYGSEGWIDPNLQDHVGDMNRWGFSVIGNIRELCEWGPWIGLGVLALWGLFEWRVRSENKTAMRLGGLGTIAAALCVAAGFISAAIILPMIISLNPYERAYRARDMARDAAARIEAGVAAIERELPAENWVGKQVEVSKVRRDFMILRATGVGMPWLGVSEADSEMAPINVAHRAIYDAESAARNHAREAFERDLKEFQGAFAQLKGKGAATQGR